MCDPSVSGVTECYSIPTARGVTGQRGVCLAPISAGVNKPLMDAIIWGGTGVDPVTAIK